MNLVLELFTKREITIIVGVLGILILVVLILTLLDILSKRKHENNEVEMAFSDPSLDLTNVNKEIKEEITSVQEEQVINKEEIASIQEEQIISEVGVEELKEVTMDDKKSSVTEMQEVKPVSYIEPIIIDDFEEEKQVVKPVTNLQQELQKIESELTNPKSLEDTLYDLELEEEENAIISYQQLLENTSELEKVVVDSGDEIISLKEMINQYDASIDNTIEENMTKVSIDEAYKGDFTSTPLLSPIIGLEGSSKEVTDLAEIQLENTANLEKLDKELRKTNQFLSILNDLKKKLD